MKILKKQLVSTQVIYDDFKPKVLIVEKQQLEDGSLVKKVIVQDEPTFTFYQTIKGHEVDYPIKLIERDKVKPITCKYHSLIPTLAKITGREKEFEADKGKRVNRNKYHNNYNIHQSDFHIEDYKMKEWTNENKELIAPLPISKSFFDIEVDVSEYEGFPYPDQAPVPINFISYLNEEKLELKAYVLINHENQSMMDFLQEHVGEDEDEYYVELNVENNGWCQAIFDQYYATQEVNEKGEPKPWKPLKGLRLQFFKEEVTLITKFLVDVKKDKPDFCGA